MSERSPTKKRPLTADEIARSTATAGRLERREHESVLVDQREAGWIKDLLDRAGVPVQSYEAQGGGMCAWTLAGRVDHVLRLLAKHGIAVDEGVINPVAPS